MTNVPTENLVNDKGSTCLTSFPATLTGCNAALSEGRLDTFLLEDEDATSIRFNRFDAKRESSAVRGRFPSNGDIPDADNRGKDMIDRWSLRNGRWKLVEKGERIWFHW